MSDVLRVDARGATTILTIARPQARNALTRGVVTGLTEALKAAASEASVRCVVLTGAGEHFCAGADLRQNFADDPRMLDHIETYMDEYHALIGSVVGCPKPVIAMMDGAAVGFGADLAFSCDLRVASTRAYVQEKFVKIGLLPDGGGTFWLPRLVGTARAMQMILLAEKVDALELERMGVLVRRVPPETLLDATLEIARTLESGPPLAHAAVKRALYASWGSVVEALRREREEQLRLLRSADCMEGVMAWAERREPRFHGR